MALFVHAQTLISAIRKFGLAGGATAYADNAVLRILGRERLRERRIGSSADPLFYRAGTSDWYALTQVFFNEEYNSRSEAHEAAMDRCYESILASGKIPLIVDCGANIGLAALWFSRRYPRAQIVAVEPEPSNFEVLRLNTRNIENVRPVHAAISDRKSRVCLRNESGGGNWAWETVESEQGELATTTIGEILDGCEGAALFIAKIDIEGFEVELFRSNTDWADLSPLVVFESHDHNHLRRGTAHSILSVLSKRPRDYIQMNENTFAFSHELLPS